MVKKKFLTEEPAKRLIKKYFSDDQTDSVEEKAVQGGTSVVLWHQLNNDNIELYASWTELFKTLCDYFAELTDIGLEDEKLIANILKVIEKEKANEKEH